MNSKDIKILNDMLTNLYFKLNFTKSKDRPKVLQEINDLKKLYDKKMKEGEEIYEA